MVGKGAKFLPTTLVGWLGLTLTALLLLSAITGGVVGAVSTYLDVKDTKATVEKMEVEWKVELKELRDIIQESNIMLGQRVSNLEGKIE